MSPAQPRERPPTRVARSRTAWALVWSRQEFEDDEDPHAAPSDRGRTSEAPRHSWRFGADHGVRSFLTGWLFLLFLLVPVLASVDDATDVVAAIAVVVLVGLTYTGAAWMAESPLAARLGYLAGFTVLVLGGTGWLTGSFAFAMTPYVAVVTAHLVPWRYARVIVAVVGLAGIVVGAVTMNWYAILLSVVAIGLGMLLGSGLENARLGRRLERSEARVATLAVAAERERIARDLHDILGHSLTAVAVKAGLASRLATIDPDATREQLQEIEQVARQALADVRVTAGELRQVRLANELAGAVSVLQAAGVRCSTPSALPPMSDEVSEFLGYVVREGITNVVRHADATAVDITVNDIESAADAAGVAITVVDDGHGPAGPAPGDGSGLAGLAARAAVVNGVVRFHAGAAGGSVLTAEVPDAALGGARRGPGRQRFGQGD